jgi:hypothetical protein
VSYGSSFARIWLYVSSSDFLSFQGSLPVLLLSFETFAGVWTRGYHRIVAVVRPGDSFSGINLSSGSPDKCWIVQKSMVSFAKIVAEMSDKMIHVGSQRVLWRFGPGCVALYIGPGNKSRVKTILNRNLKASFPPSCCKCPILPPRCKSASSHGGQIH